MKLPALDLTCPACEKAFTRLQGLRKHQRSCKSAATYNSAEPLTVTLDTLPVGMNHAYKHVTLRSKSGKVYTARRLSDPAQAWRKLAVLRIREAATAQTWAVLEGTPIAVRVVFSMPDLFVRDLDNLVKLPLDALKDAIGADDRYIVDLHPQKVQGPERVTISVQVQASDQALADWSRA